MNRIIFKDNAVLTDKSTEMESYTSGAHTQTIVAAEDAIFIGYDYPISDLYIEVTSANTAASTMKVQVWGNDSWIDTAEIIDGTSLNGASLGQSGHVSFVPKKEQTWEKESTNYAGEVVSDLSAFVIYDKYWFKITFTGNMTPVTISWIGAKFADDSDLAAEYPDLNRTDVKSAWQSGKTNWNEQAIIASDMLAKDLMEKKVIDDKAQLLDRRELVHATVAKMAKIIFSGMGLDYADNARNAENDYIKRVSSWMPRKIDVKLQGRVDDNQQLRFGRMIR